MVVRRCLAISPLPCLLSSLDADCLISVHCITSRSKLCYQKAMDSLMTSMPPQSSRQQQQYRYHYCALSAVIQSYSSFYHQLDPYPFFSIDSFFRHFVRVFDSDETVFLVIQFMLMRAVMITCSILCLLFVLFMISRERDKQLLKRLREEEKAERRALITPHHSAKPVPVITVKEKKKRAGKKKELDGASETSLGKESCNTISSLSSQTESCEMETAGVRCVEFHVECELVGAEDKLYVVMKENEWACGGECLNEQHDSTRYWLLSRLNDEFTARVSLNGNAVSRFPTPLSYRYAIYITRKQCSRWCYSEWMSQYLTHSKDGVVVLSTDRPLFRKFRKHVQMMENTENRSVVLPVSQQSSPEGCLLSSPEGCLLSSPSSEDHALSSSQSSPEGCMLSSQEGCHPEERSKDTESLASTRSLDSNEGNESQPRQVTKSTLRILTLPGEAEDRGQDQIAFGTNVSDSLSPRSVPFQARVQPPVVSVPTMQSPVMPVPAVAFPQQVMYPPFYQSPVMMVVGPNGQPMMVTPFPQPLYVYPPGVVPPANQSEESK